MSAPRMAHRVGRTPADLEEMPPLERRLLLWGHVRQSESGHLLLHSLWFFGEKWAPANEVVEKDPEDDHAGQERTLGTGSSRMRAVRFRIGHQRTRREARAMRSKSEAVSAKQQKRSGKCKRTTSWGGDLLSVSDPDSDPHGEHEAPDGAKPWDKEQSSGADISEADIAQREAARGKDRP
eukprot:1801325-Rhodomonas_salina.1